MKCVVYSMAKPQHSAALAELSKANLQDHWSAAAFQSEGQNPYSKIFVAFMGTNPIGFLASHMADSGIIQSFAVDRPYRGQGVGGALFEKFLTCCKEAQLSAITLDVRVNNSAAIAFYRDRGFVISHTVKNFYQSPVEDAHVMLLTPLP